MATMVSITIDQQQVQAAEGANLLQAARDAGFNLPSLCYHPRLSPSGSCRLCAVKIEGRAGLVPACTVEVTAGLNVTAFDAELEQRRRMLVDLFLADHNCNCLNCDAAGECELQELAHRYGLMGLSPKRFQHTYRKANARFSRFPGLGLAAKKQPPPQVAEKGGGVYSGVPADCIRCSACIEACPMNLYPVLIMEAQQQQDKELLLQVHPADCINCEMCSYVCPAAIRLVKYIEQAEEAAAVLNKQSREGA